MILFYVVFSCRSFQSPETHHRPPELETIISRLELPKSRVAAKLPSRTVETLPSERESEEDDVEDEGMWDRRYAKMQSQKSVRAEQKKAARQSRLDSLSSTI